MQPVIPTLFSSTTTSWPPLSTNTYNTIFHSQPLSHTPVTQLPRTSIYNNVPHSQPLSHTPVTQLPRTSIYNVHDSQPLSHTPAAQLLINTTTHHHTTHYS